MHTQGRTYVLAADTLSDMRTWMNLLALASIAFGSGAAAVAASAVPAPTIIAGDVADELVRLAGTADARRGGVRVMANGCDVMGAG